MVQENISEHLPHSVVPGKVSPSPGGSGSWPGQEMGQQFPLVTVSTLETDPDPVPTRTALQGPPSLLPKRGTEIRTAILITLIINEVLTVAECSFL